MLVTSNGNNRLDGVTVEGDLTLAANSALLRIANGLTLDGTIHMDGNGATLGFEGSQTLSGSGTIQFGTSGSGNRYLEMASDGTLTIDAGITLRGGKANVGGSSRWGRSMSLINQGAILADVPGQTLRIQASRGSFVNQGLLLAAGGTLNVDQLTGNLGDAAASGGGHLDLDGTYTNDRQLTIDASTLTLRGDWTNADTLVASGATINLDGSFTLADVGTLQRTGGSVQLVGTLDNTATTLTLNSASGSWTMQGGTVIGGTIVTTPEASLLVTSNGNNRLDGVTVEGDLTLAANIALLRIANGLTLDGTIHMDGNGATLGFEGSQTLSGSGTIQFGTSGSGNRYLEMASDGTLTIDAGITLRGGKANVGGSSAGAGRCR